MSKFLSALLKEARLSADMTLRSLAEKVGVMPSYLSELESGLRPAPKDEGLLHKLASILNIEYSTVSIAAKRDRERRDIKAIRELLITDDELAASYCRAKETWNQEEMKAALLKVFSKTDE